MKLPLTALVMISAFGLRPAGAAADDRKKLARALEAELKGRTVVLRNYYSGERLEYDSNGQLKGGGPPGTWTLDGHVQIKQLNIDQDKLEIKGDRVYMEFDTMKKEWHGLAGPSLTVHIGTPSGELTTFEVQSLLLKIILGPSEDTESLVPSYWLPALEGKKPSEVAPQERGLLDGDAVEATGLKTEVGAPQIVHAPEPPYPKGVNITGNVVLYALIGKDGSVRDVLETSRVLGGGLDQSAISTVRAWKLKPALKNGVPVPALVTVETTFRKF